MQARFPKRTGWTKRCFFCNALAGTIKYLSENQPLLHMRKVHMRVGRNKTKNQIIL
jgi:hypothetical protein